MSTQRRAQALPVVKKFSGHETFPFRYAWMNKIADGLSGNKKISFRDHEQVMVRLGVGKNMVQSMQYWGKALGVLTPACDALTDFGQQMFPSTGGLDPYLEDPNTIWLLQWHLARNETQSTTWWWAFNSFDGGSFTKNQLYRQLGDALTYQDQSIPRSLDRDIQVFIQSYVGALKPGVVKEDTLDCPLTELALIRSVKTSDVITDGFQFVVGEHESLSDAIFTYALTDYLEERLGDAQAGTVPFEELLNGVNSLGRVFRLSEMSLLRRLDRVTKVEEGLRFDDTAGLKQLTVNGLPTKKQLLETHFAHS
jgi:hypothetical protein